MDKELHSCYDICCGAGIFSLGFGETGFKILGGIDNNKYTIDTVKLNIKEGKWENISIQEILNKIKDDISHPIHKADIIITGLPCQGFSTAGKGKPGDPRNSLYKYLIKIIEYLKPSFVVIENVRGLLIEKNRKHFYGILCGLKKLGYSVDYRLYDAVNFGVPQFRKRVFIIASHNIPVEYVFQNIHHNGEYKTVRDALEGLSFKKEIPFLNHTFMNHSNKVVRKIKRIKDTSLISYRKLKWNKPSVTVVSGHSALPVHPKEDRTISVREAARIQTISDNYIFRGSRTEQAKQVANAVPLIMVKNIARAIKKSRSLMCQVRGPLYHILESKINEEIKIAFQEGFVKYFQKQARDYPWRNIKDPYKILITEILLQRTKGDSVNRVWAKVMHSIKKDMKGYRINNLSRYMKKLGIFNRSKTVKSLNSTLSRCFRNKVPENYDELKNLPGVGIYIASAVRTFAFNIPDFPVDSNAFRFIKRFFGVNIKGSKMEAAQIREFMNTVIILKKPREYVYGFLDFSSTICVPLNPKCDCCFLSMKCKHFG